MDMDMPDLTTGEGAAYLDAMAAATTTNQTGTWPSGDDAMLQSMPSTIGGGSESGRDFTFPMMPDMFSAQIPVTHGSHAQDLSVSAATIEPKTSRPPSASASSHSGTQEPGLTSIHSAPSVHSVQSVQSLHSAAHSVHSASATAHQSIPQHGAPVDNNKTNKNNQINNKNNNTNNSPGLMIGTSSPTGPGMDRSGSYHSRSIASGGSVSSAASPQTSSAPSSSASSECACMEGTVRVVQQLDDDEFHITTLTLDQVLRLQKTIITHCMTAVGCADCKSPSDVQAMLVIICDRLAEMFECIHRRMEKVKRRLASGLPLAMRHLVVPARNERPTRDGQLFCSTTGGLANKADCNPGLFLPGLEALYSEQEQVHLIEVLLRLQMENFETLLNRIIQTRQATVSQARRSKLHNILTRLSEARADIEADVREVFQMVTPVKSRPLPIGT